MNTIKAFIIYAKEDLEIALKIYNDLNSNGITPWLDKKDLLGGQNWRINIDKAIQNCDYFIVLLSSNSISKKGFVQKEIKIALDLLSEYPQTDVYVIPVRLEECQPLHENLADLHWIDIFPNYNEGIRNIIKSLNCLSDTSIHENINIGTISQSNLVAEEDALKQYLDTADEILAKLSRLQQLLVQNDMDSAEKIMEYVIDHTITLYDLAVRLRSYVPKLDIEKLSALDKIYEVIAKILNNKQGDIFEFANAISEAKKRINR